MARRILWLLVPCLAFAEEWTVYRMGPFEVFTDRNKDKAREVLNHCEQLRWAFSYYTGKTEPKTIWPIRIIVSRRPVSAELVLVNDAWRGFLDEKKAVPWNAQILRILIDDNLGRMPREIEDGLVAALSTAEISGTHIVIGQPPAKPTLDWARMRLLMTSDDYRGRTRVVIANLDKAVDMDVAFRNALSKTRVEIDKEAEAHLGAAATYDLDGKPLNANRDFTPRVPDEDVMRRALGEKSLPETAMGLFDAGQFEAASKVKPDWWEPYYRLSKVEADQGKKAGLLKKAAELVPRDAAIWTEFAVLMTDYQRWIDADKAWAQAERAAIDSVAREAIHAKRRAMAEERAAAEEAAKREARLAKEREIQQLKNDVIARVREAENKVNAGKTINPNTKIHDWWEGPQADAKIAGTLRRVNCTAGRASLVIDAAGKITTLRVADPSKIAVTGGDQKSLSCGVQKPARTVEVEYFSKTKEATVIRFQ